MQLIDRTLQTITVLNDYPEGVSVGELSERLSLPVSTVHRILSSLKENQYVVQDMKTRLYRLSYLVLSFGANMRMTDTLLLTARPEMELLSKQVGKLVVLAVRIGNEVMCAQSVSAVENYPYLTRVGYRYPMHISAAGIVFLSGMSPQEQKDLIAWTYEHYPDFTPEAEAFLYKEIARVKKEGFTITDVMTIKRLKAVSAPIIDGLGNIVSALVISVLSDDERELMDSAAYLMEATYRISKSLQRKTEKTEKE